MTYEVKMKGVTQRLLGLCVALGVLGCMWSIATAHASAEAEELFRDPISYRGPDGMYVTIQEFEQEGAKKALLTLEQHPTLGTLKSYVCTVKEDRRSIRYLADFESPSIVVAEKQISHAGTVSLRVPRLSQRGWYRFEYPTSEDDKKLLQRDAESFRKRYYYHRSSVTATPLSEVTDLLHKSCQHSVVVDFQADAFSQTFREAYNAEAMCDDVLLGVMGICMDEVGKEAVQQAVQSISCSSGKQFSVNMHEGTLQVQLAPGSGEISSRVHSYLMDVL